MSDAAHCVRHDSDVGLECFEDSHENLPDTSSDRHGLAAMATSAPGSDNSGTSKVPQTSYSSSDDDDFFDAEDSYKISPAKSPSGSVGAAGDCIAVSL